MSSAGNVRERHIDHELRRVDDAFAMLRPGKELDERLDDLLDGRAVPRRAAAPRIAIAAMAVGAIAVVVAFLAQREPSAMIAAIPDPPVVEQPPERVTTTTTPGESVASREPSAAHESAAPALQEDVRFIDVPMGRLEVRAPSTVAVHSGRAVVTSGSARLFERGKPPRTLLRGQSIAWKIPAAGSSSGGTAQHSGMDDADIEAMLAQARAHEARGAYGAAADALADLLSRKPPSRVADTVGFERASLLARGRNMTDACAALAAHARKFPASENAADVAALRTRLACR